MEDLHSSGTVAGDRIAYLGGRNVTYDLSGEDPRFYCGEADIVHPTKQHSPDQIVVFEAGQVHTFLVPVFLDSIVVEKYNSDDNTWVEIARDPSRKDGWLEVEHDSAAMSQAYLLDKEVQGGFDKVLVKQIQFALLKEGGSDKIYIRISYQRFYMDLYDFNKFDGVGPSYTPALGKYVLDKLQDIESQVAANIANTFAVTDSVNDMLEEDLTGTFPQNYVQDEQHVVAVPDGIDTLMPARGSFYSHDFRMWQYTVRTGTVQMANKRYNLDNQAIFIYKEVSTIGSSTSKTVTTKKVYLTEENYDDYIGLAGSFIDRAKAKLMVPDKDYILTNLNVAKTEKSESEYGVYDTVQFITSFSGTVMITYHAFGGAVVFEDVKDMRIDILNTMRILNSKNLLTSDVLDKQPIIRELVERVQVMEQYHNHFGQVEHAIYFGKKGFHWFNIAMLYDIAWGKEVGVVDEIGTFRVESLIRHWCYEFVLSVDLKKKLVNMLRCKTLATNDVTCSDFKDYVAYITSRDDLAIRVCWCGDGTKSGLMLQLGWNFDNYGAASDGIDTDTLIVTNKSGMTSKWKLVYNPLDNTFEAPHSRRMYNHTEFVPTTDTVYQSGKKYYFYETIYTYYRTASERVKKGTEYYSLVRDAVTDTTEYRKVNLIENYPISDYITGKCKPECKNGVYERTLYRKIPRKLDTFEPGTAIPDPANTFEVSNGSYSEDKIIQMPDPDFRWVENTTNCQQLRRVLEPADGLLVWAGSVKLDLYNAQSFTLNSTLNSYTQPILDISTIRGLTVKLYDRKLDKIISRQADVGYAEAEYTPATGTAVAGKIYYKRMGEGTATNPFRFFRENVAEGASLGEGVYYTLKACDKIIGQIIFDLLDLCGAKVEVYKDEATELIKFNFFNYIGTDSQINQRFDFRQIELHF